MNKELKKILLNAKSIFENGEFSRKVEKIVQNIKGILNQKWMYIQGLAIHFQE
ncbi:hypothetical protein [Oceanobacillus indicireducens]|uniref:Uncharacterized protein n=1 Tax=Oceanobacillus indicireducens TaxID=1004261 RepID=A0A917XYW7_9BACI|nr:hypothetical protein [Oceanobacillus indicireducens]GGN57543.1 hypothetical protein GCM10007971_18580 [Oceanobacillus indicireducens]